MNAGSSSFSSNCGHLQPTRYGSFCFCSKSPGKELCVLNKRPKDPGHRRIFSQLGGGGQLMYAFPHFNLIQKCLQKVIKDRAQVLLVAPVWRSRPWCPILLDLLTDQPCLLPVDPLLVHLPWKNLPHPLLSHHNFRLAMWPLSGNLCSRRIYQKGCLKFCWLHRKNTEKQYEPA